jgi:hypothetical protein
MTRFGWLFAALCLAPAALASAAGCNDVEVVDPVSTTTTTTTTEPGPDAGPGPTGVPPKRTVLLRNPLGGPPNNLLLDGDFELSISSGGGQHAWRAFNSSGTAELPLTAETGGLCRSGLACVRFEKGQILFGRGAGAPDGKGHVMSLHARMPEGVHCKEVDLVAVDCDSFAVLEIAKYDPEPDAGWCRHTGTFGPASGAVCFYLANTLDPGQVALLDAAVLGPNDGTVPYQATPDEPLDAETLATMARVRDLLRRTRPFGRPIVTGPSTPRSLR